MRINDRLIFYPISFRYGLPSDDQSDSSSWRSAYDNAHTRSSCCKIYYRMYTRQEYLVNSVISEQKPIVHNNSVFIPPLTICAVITTSQYSRHSFHQKDNYLVPECSATWRCQLLLTVNWSPHSLQTNGFTPRWERICCSNRASRRYAWEIKFNKQKVEQELCYKWVKRYARNIKNLWEI